MQRLWGIISQIAKKTKKPVSWVCYALSKIMGFRIVHIYSCDDSFKGCLFPKIKEIGVKSSFSMSQEANIGMIFCE